MNVGVNFEILVAETIPGKDVYVVSGDSVSVLREDGSVEKLTGTDLERARRWVIDRARPPSTQKGDPSR